MTKITKDEFIDKVIKGERDFSGLKFDDKFLLIDTLVHFPLVHYLEANYKHPRYDEMQEYLLRCEEDSENEPIILNGSEFVSANFTGLYLPNLEAKNIKVSYYIIFNSALLMEADFEGSEMDADFRYAYMPDANLNGVTGSSIRLEEANLKRANLGFNYKEAKMHGCNLYNADLTKMQGFPRDIANANFYHTKVTEEQKKELEERLAHRRNWDVK